MGVFLVTHRLLCLLAPLMGRPPGLAGLTLTLVLRPVMGVFQVAQLPYRDSSHVCSSVRSDAGRLSFRVVSYRDSGCVCSSVSLGTAQFLQVQVFASSGLLALQCVSSHVVS